MKLSYTSALRCAESFLDKYYLRDNGDDLSLFLSDMSLDTFMGGGTADPAAWYDWLKAINEIKGGENSDQKLSDKEAFQAMIIFLKTFGQRINSSEIFGLLSEFLIDDTKREAKPAIWKDWQNCWTKFTDN